MHFEMFFLRKTYGETLIKKSFYEKFFLFRPSLTLLSAYISSKKLCSYTFKASSKELILMHSEKMKAKNMSMCESVFFVKLQDGILQLHHRLTSS